MRKMWLLLLLALGLNLPVLAQDEEEELEVNVSSEVRVRSEGSNNKDFNDAKAKDDKLDWLNARYRLGLEIIANDSMSVFFQPQYSGVLGQDGQVLDGERDVSFDRSGTPVTEKFPKTKVNPTSGGTAMNPGLGIYQAYFTWKTCDYFTLRAGRQEIAYGDQLIFGAVDWANNGRAYDSVKGQFSLGFAKADLTFAVLSETNFAKGSGGDKDMLLNYWMFDPSKLSFTDSWLKEFDLYWLIHSDRTFAKDGTFEALGSRFKTKPLAGFDFRFEDVFEMGKTPSATAAADFKAYMADAELGYGIKELLNSRISLEYAYASRDYNQLYPTTHKWLGFVDLFGRRNIQDIVASYAFSLLEVKTKFDYHYFSRVDNNDPVYSIPGTAIGAGNGSKDSYIGQEADLTITKVFMQKFTAMAGASLFMPGGYIKDQAALGKDSSSWYYVQGSMKF